VSRILVMSAGLLLGCASVPVDQQDFGADLIDVGAAKFAVYSEDGRAVAVYLGALSHGVDESLLYTAQIAMERATGCPVYEESLEQNAKMVSARLLCDQSTSIFLRARAVRRGKTARSGLGPPAQYLAELRAQSVAEEQRIKLLKQ